MCITGQSGGLVGRPLVASFLVPWVSSSSSLNAPSGRRSRRSSRGWPTSTGTTSGCPRAEASCGTRVRHQPESRLRGRPSLTKRPTAPPLAKSRSLQAPHTLVFHWWDSSKSGKLKAEGWPGYSLQSADADHDARAAPREDAHVSPLSSGDAGTSQDRREGTHRHSRFAQGVIRDNG